MAEQYKNLAKFKAYQKRIYEFISQELVKLPYFFEKQTEINGTSQDNFAQTQGGMFQRTIVEGSLKKGRKVNEALVAFDNVYSQDGDDLNIIEQIAFQLQGYEPSVQTLQLDAIVQHYEDGMEPPYSTYAPFLLSENYQEAVIDNQAQTHESYGNALIYYQPILKFVGTNNNLLLSPQTTIPAFENNLNNPNYTLSFTLDEFKTYIKTNFNIDIDSQVQTIYNLSDNTGQFLPVGVQKRSVSKKLLKDTSETEITEILPETDLYKITEFYKQWKKVKDIIPLGTEYILGATYLTNGNFGGGVGPGLYRTAHQESPLTMLTSGYNLNDMFSAVSGDPNSPWGDSDFQREKARISQRIQLFENPGFSPFCLGSERNSPAWYKVKIMSNEVYPGVPYTLSAWQTEDEFFNPNNFEELQLGNLFFYKVVATTNDSTPDGENEIVVVDWPNQANFFERVRGEAIQSWQSGTNLWTRWKKTITLPMNGDGKGLDINGQIIPDTHLINSNKPRYRVYWYVGYQNTTGDYEGPIIDSDIWPGPIIRANPNQSKQWFTGIRMNRGSEVSAANSIDLAGQETNTIAGLLSQCVDLLEPDKYDIPIYSKGKVDSLLLSQQASATIIALLDEIKDGLIKTLTDFTGGVSESFKVFAESIANAALQAAAANEEPPSLTYEDVLQLVEGDEGIVTKINQSGLPSAINQLNDNLTNTFALLNTNLAELNVEPYNLELPIIQEMQGYSSYALSYTTGNNNQNNAYNSYQGHTPHFDINIRYSTNNGGSFNTSGQNAVPDFMQGIGLNQTPIGAMYASEMYQFQQGQSYRRGNPDLYYTQPNAYPGTGYGPYSQAEVNYGVGNSWTYFASDGLERTKGIVRAYFEGLQAADSRIWSLDESTQFQGMDAYSGYINDNFEPLREYIFYTGHGTSFMWMVYPYIARNQSPGSWYGWYNTDVWNGAGGNSWDGPPSNRVGGTGYWQYGWDQDWEAGDPGQPTQGYMGDEPYRFYEPHWEWNPNKGVNGEWVFRFAQPVVGTGGPSSTDVMMNNLETLNSPGWPNDGQGNANANNPYLDGLGERKYKLKRVNMFRTL